MNLLHEARFYESLPKSKVLCTLCPHDCLITVGSRGACSVRYNHSGKLYTLVYDKLVAREVNPIEKKPLYHFYPGSFSYSISTVGCNLRCSFCQNWHISQWPKEHLPKHIDQDAPELADPVCPQMAAIEGKVAGEWITPTQIVEATLASGCRSISYTFTEPTIFYELAYDTAVLAKEKGLMNNFVSNGFISEAPLRELAPVLDAINIDLKFFREKSYRHFSRARLQPILDAIHLYHELGVWVEITTLIIPELNGSDEELQRIAHFIYSIGEEIPWHVTAFYPAYRMLDRPSTSISLLRRAREIGLSEGLRYVYQGNIPGEDGENTYCYNCKKLLIKRLGFSVQKNHISEDGSCPYCETPIDGLGMSVP